MPAFDINAILSAALATAVAEATQPLVERIAALEINITMMQNSIDQKDARIAALENNPAQGVDTSVLAGSYTPVSNERFKAMLQEWATTGGFLTREEVREIADACIERSMDNHLECYNHDNYDEIASKVEDINFDDLVKTDDLSDSVRDAVQDLSFEVSVS